MKKNTNPNFQKFSDWLDRLCQNTIFPDDAEAMCFNIYDDGEYYGVQLTCSNSFNFSNGDWDKNEVFSSGEDLCLIKKSEDISNFKLAEKFVTEYVKEYLCNGQFSAKLKAFKAIAIGFVDGDLFVVQI